MKTIGILTTALITIIFGPIWRGYAFSKLWLWFVVSTFGAVPLGIAQSIGLASVVSFLTYHYRPQKKDERETTEKLIEAVTVAALTPAFALGFGWIVKSWI